MQLLSRLAANNSKLIEINIYNIQGTVYTNAHIELFGKPIAAGKSEGVLIKSIYAFDWGSPYEVAKHDNCQNKLSVLNTVVPITGTKLYKFLSLASW